MRDIVPEGARFIDGSFSNPAGSRAYRLFIPSRYQGQPLPLIVMLHGCTQSPDDFAAGTRMNFLAEAQPCFVVYPAQRSDANPAKCWNWFRHNRPAARPGRALADRGDHAPDHARLLGRSKRVYVAGLSAGGGGGRHHGSNLYRSLRGRRRPFRPRLRRRHRPSLGASRDATRRRLRSSNGFRRPANCSDHCLPRRSRQHGASRQR